MIVCSAVTRMRLSVPAICFLQWTVAHVACVRGFTLERSSDLGLGDRSSRVQVYSSAPHSEVISTHLGRSHSTKAGPSNLAGRGPVGLMSSDRCRLDARWTEGLGLGPAATDAIFISKARPHDCEQTASDRT